MPNFANGDLPCGLLGVLFSVLLLSPLLVASILLLWPIFSSCVETFGLDLMRISPASRATKVGSVRQSFANPQRRSARSLRLESSVWEGSMDPKPVVAWLWDTVLGIDVGKALGWTSNVVISSSVRERVYGWVYNRRYLQITNSIESKADRYSACRVHAADAIILRWLLGQIG